MTQAAQPPPQNLEAEESVLGAMMLSSNVIDNVQETGLKADDFYRESHGVIYKAMTAMHSHGVNVDSITVTDYLEKLGVLGKAGGKQRVYELAALVPASANAPHYARIVNDLGTLRRLISTGQQIARLGWERPGETQDLIAQAEQLLTQAVTPAISSQFESNADTVDELVKRIEEAMESGEPRMGTKTGFVDLDRALTGMHPGQLILVAARPGMGKSALALNVAENVADTYNGAAYLTLEMSKEELAIRSISRLSKIDGQRIRLGKMRPDQVPAFKQAVESVKKRKLWVEDATDTTIQKLRAEAKRLHRLKKPDVLVVDYLQLMLSSITTDSRQQEVSMISRSLKLLAKDLGLPILALSQLNRNLEGRQDKRPQLSDLRDSGSLEQDADVVLFIYRDDQYNKETTEVGMAEVIIGKNRMGPSETVNLTFNARTTTFKNPGSGLLEAAA